jgi:hypothetical protein
VVGTVVVTGVALARKIGVRVICSTSVCNGVKRL